MVGRFVALTSAVLSSLVLFTSIEANGSRNDEGALAAPLLFATEGGDCAAQARLVIDKTTTVTSATLVPAGPFTPPGSSTTPITGLPSFCRVIGVAKPTSDSNINFEVWLPAGGWNGKYLSVGEGGFAGSIAYAALADSVKRGYATASTDTGHVTSDEWWMINHLEKMVDYGYRGKHLQTVAAKALIKGYYGEGPRLSYFSGCSNGGRQGMHELQRYPEDYDAYIIGAPANNWTGQTTYWMWMLQALNDPASKIPDTKLPAIQAAALAACDAIDGVKDSVIDDPRKCNFDPSVLQCTAGPDNDNCLTARQVAALKKLYAGPKNSAGQQLFPADEPGTEAVEDNWVRYATGTPAGSARFRLGLHTVGGMVYNTKTYDYMRFNFDEDVRVMDDKLARILNATNPDLTAQKARGIKIIQYHGWGDAALAPRESVNYYEKVMAKFGEAQTQDFYRLFMVPGMVHCRGGLGPNSFGQSGTPALVDPDHDVVKALERWVEQKAAPDKIIATKFVNDEPAKGVVSTRPICAYPKVAKYKGTGLNDKDAASFVCVNP